MSGAGGPLVSYVRFWQDVTRYGAAPCWLCERTVSATVRDRCRYISGGIMDGHHLCPKALLKREFPFGAYVNADGTVDRMPAEHRKVLAIDQVEVNGVRIIPLDVMLGDPRNGIPLGRWHHDEVEQVRVRIPRRQLPASVEEFAAELDLGWWLDRRFGERTEAAA